MLIIQKVIKTAPKAKKIFYIQFFFFFILQIWLPRSSGQKIKTQGHKIRKGARIKIVVDMKKEKKEKKKEIYLHFFLNNSKLEKKEERNKEIFYPAFFIFQSSKERKKERKKNRRVKQKQEKT